MERVNKDLIRICGKTYIGRLQDCGINNGGAVGPERKNILRAPHSYSSCLSLNLSNHMDKQARKRDTE
jgi:hypothetical protein